MTAARRAASLPGWPRRQPPVHSPIPIRSLIRAWSGRRNETVAVLRARLSERFGAETVLLTNSGTTALRVAIQAAVGPGGAVALPAFSCYDLVTAAVGADARVVLYDLDPTTLGPDQESLESALGAGAGAAVIAPLYGIPVDWTALESLAARHQVVLIEDAAQGHGARLHGRPLGSFGELSILSFGRGKGWTGAGGGALLWRRVRQPPAVGPAGVPEARAAVSGLVQSFLSRPEVYWLPASLPGLALGETRYHPPGPDGAINRFQASLLLETEAAADVEADVRRVRGATLRAALEDSGVTMPEGPTGSSPGYLRFPVLASGGLRGLRDRAEAERLGVAPSYPTPLAQVPALGPRLVDVRPCPGADRLSRELLTLPTHGQLSGEEAERLVRLFDGIAATAADHP